jgi:hypothetical protein
MEHEEAKLRTAMDKFAQQRKAALQKDDADQLKRIEKSEAAAIAAYQRQVKGLLGSLNQTSDTEQRARTPSAGNSAPKRQNQQTKSPPKRTPQPKARGFRLFGLGR